MNCPFGIRKHRIYKLSNLSFIPNLFVILTYLNHLPLLCDWNVQLHAVMQVHHHPVCSARVCGFIKHNGHKFARNILAVCCCMVMQQLPCVGLCTPIDERDALSQTHSSSTNFWVQEKEISSIHLSLCKKGPAGAMSWSIR